ncbi:MAG TPA: EcsC family protein [Pseudomonadales bacterium]|nr:EcsC family protein [Pseudomonadales bacterium]
MKSLTPYEQTELQHILDWKKTPPAFFNRASHAFWGLPDWLNSRLAKNGTVLSALQAANNAAKFLADKKDILREAEVDDIAELRLTPLNECDTLARQVQNWAIAICAGEGLAIGFTGAWGLAVDIPFTITFALRTIHKIGLCYGFEPESPDDDWYAMAVLAASCANNEADKQAALQLMHAHMQIGNGKKKTTPVQPPTERVLFNLATQINLNLAQRKALQVIPIVGTAAGLTVNALFIHDICLTARRAFQERWFRLHHKYKEPQAPRPESKLLDWFKRSGK